MLGDKRVAAVKAALQAYAGGLQECAALRWETNPNREQDFPEVWFWLCEPSGM